MCSLFAIRFEFAIKFFFNTIADFVVTYYMFFNKLLSSIKKYFHLVPISQLLHMLLFLEELY